MPGPGAGVALLAGSFLVGSIPWGYLAGRLMRGIDLRAVGSGGTGATNVQRTLGTKASVVVFALDFLKGMAPVLIARYFQFDPVLVGAAAVAAVAGHCWSPFIGFKGGKGVATGAGASIALFPLALVAFPVLALLVWSTRFMSLGSLAAAALAALLALAFAAAGELAWSWAVAILAIAAIIVVRHKDNIQRLRAGTERRVGESVSI